MHRLVCLLQSHTLPPSKQTYEGGLGGEPGSITPEQFAQMNRQEFTRFGDLIKKANIKLE